MIKKSFLVAAALLVLYHFSFPHISRHFFQLSGQMRGNYMRGEQYVYDVPDETNLVLGSSRSMELNEETLGPNYFKLTFPGGSIFTGLEIICRAHKHPRVVLVETNNIEWTADQQFLHELFNPLQFELRRHSSAFREEGRPSNFVLGVAEACVRKSCLLGSRLIFRNTSHEDPVLQLEHEHLVARSQLIATYVPTLQRVPPKAVLTDQANRLGDYVDRLNEEGCRCVLFEMPIDSTLADLPEPTAQRTAVRVRFPSDKYDWLSFKHDHNYDTVDGVHLTRPEADQLSQNVVEQINRIVHQPKRHLTSTAVAGTVNSRP